MEFKLFYEITSILVLAGLISFLVSFLRQPSIIAFILTGLIVGPFGYSQLHQSGALDALGQIGITLLLFMVGLELDLKRIKQLGKISFFAGIAQIILTTAVGFFICLALGFTPLISIYVAIALTFASTIIVVKLLSEKKDLQALYARIVVGVLIIQDFAALAILLFVGGSAGEHNDLFKALPAWQYLIAMLVKVLILVLSLSWLSRKIFPKFLGRLGKSDELLMIFSLAWALGLAAFMSLPAVGFSLEIGGFVAGLALANSHVHFEISARIKSLRDFFIIIFFIVFGTKLAFGGIGALFWPVLGLCAFVLIGQPVIMMLIMAFLGYKPRTSFFAAVAMSHVSEFSFVLVALGNRLGHIPDAVVGMVTLVGVVSIAASSYFITYTRRIYEFLSPYLGWLDFKKDKGEEALSDHKLKNHIILAGANRLGSRFLASLPQGQGVVVVDFDPQMTQKAEKSGHTAICGDVTDPYIQEQINLSSAKLIVSTVPDLEDNLALLSSVKQQTAGQKRRPKLIFVAQNDFESKYWYEEGVDYVLSPHFIGGLHLSHILSGDIGLKGLKDLRQKHLSVLS